MDTLMDRDPKATKKKTGRKRTRRKRKHADDSASTRIKIAEQSMAKAIRTTYEEMFGRGMSEVRPFSLAVEIRVDPVNAWHIETDPPLKEQIRSSVREMAIQAEVYQPGRVYCYRCDSSLCSHSVPPRPGCVFGGYASTGRPLWPELVETLLELKHPHIDLLYKSNRHDLAVACMAPEILKHRQLNIFGRESKTYDILGQVVFGFLNIHCPESDPREKDRVAFTVQAVESRKRDGSPRLELNVLGRLSNGNLAMDAIQGSYQTRVFHTIASARRRIGSLAPSTRRFGKGRQLFPPSSNGPGQVMEQLKKFANNLEKLGRQRGRRTTHAEDRRFTRRHTSNAWQDAEKASDDLFFWDERRQTVVVLGPKNRVHVFNSDAKHITSILLQSEEVQSRLRRKRWVPFSGESLERFRSAAKR